MSSNPTFHPDPAGDRHSALMDKLSDTAARLKEKAAGVSRAAAEKIDENRDTAAGGLERAATALHRNAETMPGGEKVSSVAHATAEKLSATAGYVRNHDVNRMMSDLETVVKRNPGRSLLASAFLGFLVGRAFRGNDRTRQTEW